MANVLDSFSQAGTSYTEYLRKEIQKFIQLVTKVTTLPTQEDLVDFVDDISVDNISDAIEEASLVMDAIDNNPLVAKLKKDLEDSLGISFTGALQGAQLLVAGSNSPLMKVSTAMLKWPSEVATFLTYADTLAVYAKIINDNIIAKGGVNKWEDIPNTEIPEEIKEKLKASHKNIGRSLIAPYNYSLYQLAIDQIKEAVSLLEDIPYHLNFVSGNTSASAMKIATNSIFEDIKNIYTSMTKSSSTLPQIISNIKDTDLNKSTSTTQTRQSYLAREKLKGVIDQLNLTNVDQAAFIPQYLIVLNTVYNMLIKGRPTYNPPPNIFDRSSVILDQDKINVVMRYARKLYQYTLKPYRIDLFSEFYVQYKISVDELIESLDETTQQIEDLWLQIPGVKEVLEGIFAVLENTGFDAALDVLSSGDIGGFLGLNDITGTSTGMIMVAFDQIAEIGHALNLYQLSTIIEDVREDLKLKSDKKQFEQKSKKNEKLSKLKKSLNELNSTIDSATELISTVQGILNAISPTISQLGI